MTEQTEDLQKLRDKVSQLIEEKRRVQTERDGLREQMATLTDERDQARQEVTRITIDQPRANILESIAVEGMADVLQREIEHHYDVVRGDDDKDWLKTKEGQPVEIEGQPVGFTAEGINRLYEKGGLKIGSMLRGTGNTGGGAMGGSTNAQTGNAKTSSNANRSNFGLR